MSDRLHGVTENTYYRLVFDEGKVYKNFVSMDNPGTCLGATRGGSTFTIEPEIKDIPVDGAKGPVKGGRRITKINCKLTVNMLEISQDILLMALPGATVDPTTTFSPDHSEIRRSLQIALGDYISNIVILAQMSGCPGHPIGFGIENALADGNFEVPLAPNEEAVISIQFTGHFDPSDLDKEPWFLLYPEDLTTTVSP